MQKKKEDLRFCIYDFMFTLGLNSTEIKIYAFIYAFRMSEHGFYFGSRGYLAEKCGVSLRTAERVIPKLKRMGLIEVRRKEDLKGLACVEAFVPRGDEWEREEGDFGGLSLGLRAAKPKYDVIEVGEGYFSMTREQYNSLLQLVPVETLENYILRMERMLLKNGEKGVHPPHSYYKTLKKWISADFSL